MNYSIYKALSEEEFYLLAIYTLFSATESDTRKVRAAMEKLTGEPCNEMGILTKSLREQVLIKASNYNWRINAYDYSIHPRHMLPMMLWLFTERRDVISSVLDAVGSTLRPTNVQRLMWSYIISDYKDINTDEIKSYELAQQLEVLLPVVDNANFVPLLVNLDEHDFFTLISSYLTNVFDEEELIDADYVKSLINNYQQSYSFDNNILRLNCLVDLYAYMAYGRMPKELLQNNKNHRIIAALHEAYHGNMIQALEHFKRAVMINNKDSDKGNLFNSARNFLPLTVSNFFFMLTAFSTDTEDGRKKCQTLIRGTEKALTAPAKLLYGIISGGYNNTRIETELTEMLGHEKRMPRVLAALMAMYLGKKNLIEDSKNYEPRWMILRHEARQYVELVNAVTTERVFGKQGMLSAIYHKVEWENVLDDLMALSTDKKPAVQELSSRVAYYLNDIKDDIVSVRQQSILKNGRWSAGKPVTISSFVLGSLDYMNGDDREIALKMREAALSSPQLGIADILPYMTNHSRLYVGQYAPYTMVEVTEEMPYITLDRAEGGYAIGSNVPYDKVDNDVIITHRGAASINFIRLTDDQRPYYRRLLSLRFFPLEAEQQLRTFLRTIGGKVEVNSDLIEGGSTLPIVEGTSALIMQMRPETRETYAVSIFVRPLEGGRMRCTPGEGDEVIVDSNGGKHTRVHRKLSQEAENMQHLRNYQELPDAAYDEMRVQGMTLVDTYELLPLLEYAQNNPDRIICEWPEGAEMRIRQRNTATSWTGAIKKNDNGWFELEGTVEIDQGRVLTMAQLMDLAAQSRSRYIQLGEGEFVALTEKLHRKLNNLSTIASQSKGRLIISPFALALLGADDDTDELTITEDEEVRHIRQQIKESSTYSPEVPADLNATLREYQREGYQWMARLNKWGAGALLADDMGLGKTIQTITFLLSKKDEGPSLVIAPASVAPNWKTEFQRFAPSLNITMLNFAADREKVIKDAGKGDVVVTTYGLLLSVKDFITSKKWTTICLDEAHIVKNRGAKTSAVAMKLKSRYRVMLTGTPIQNHLGELWNLFQFVNPGLLGSFESFNRRFIIPIEQYDDTEARKRLERLIKPFMLRRTKDRVARELPEKEEIYQHVDLSEEEMLVYETLRQRAENLLLADQGSHVSLNTLAEITHLRQCACDIRLVENAGADNEREGSKIVALIELLQTILESHAAALVFSQFTSYLSLIRRALDKADIPYLYIDGSVPIKEREKMVERFQSGECPVFLISLKAGGLGLNLTRANYVVHMDPWWNPAIEAQATDRAHRIGQKNNVTVYHLIAESSLEEKIQRMHEQKQELVENILESTDKSYKLTGEELLKLVHS